MKQASAKEPTLINQVTSQGTEDVNEGELNYEVGEDTLNVLEATEVAVNKMISKAQQQVHPGNVRRVLSGAPEKKQPTQVRFAQWSDDTDWYDTSENRANLEWHPKV